MDRFGEWRLIEAANDTAPEPATQRGDGQEEQQPGRLRLGLVLAAVVLGLTGVAIAFAAPQAQVYLDTRGQAGFVDPRPSSSLAAAVAAPTVTTIVVDVQGAVLRPGIHRLPGDSRLGDAIAAAGGYGARVDIAAAASVLNLAAKLADGDKVYVPARGDRSQDPPATSDGDPGDGGSTTPGGLIDVNRASGEELETLPGIGPVTAGEIISAREQAQFTSVDELLSRGVVGQATFDKIRELVTVGP